MVFGMMDGEYNVLGSPVREYFKMMGALAFVHLGDVEQCWRRMKPLLPAEMSEFAEYYEPVTLLKVSTTDSNLYYNVQTPLYGNFSIN